MKVSVADKDTGWKKLFETIKEIADARVKVGVFAETGETHGDSRLNVAEIAAILEFGTIDGHIPARSAFKSTFDEKREELAAMGKKLIGQIIDGKMTTERALNIMGAKLANEIKLKITTGPGIPPPNAPSTIKKKGSSRPWVDTGRLIQSLTWIIMKKGEE